MTTHDALLKAARQLQSPLKNQRDAAEAELLAARGACVPALISVLEAPHDGAIGRHALLASALGARDALPALFEVVMQRRASADDRAFVARALAELLQNHDAFDDRARNALETLAVDDDRYVRAFCAQAFGALSDKRSKARVQALAEDRDAWVREQAGVVLRKLNAAEAYAQQQDVTTVDFQRMVDQAQSEGGTLKPLLDDLDDPRRAVNDNAIAQLLKVGKAAVPFLLDRLNSPKTRQRIGAATVLGRLQVTEAAGPLLVAATAHATSPQDTELRAVALRALANCLTGMEEGLAASIVPLGKDADRFVRAAAMLCLGRLADRAGLAVIVAGILDDDAFVVESAAVALSEGVREEDVEIVAPLLHALNRRPAPPVAVKEAILIALSRIQIDIAAQRVRVRHCVRKEIFGQTASTRKAAIVLLERLFQDADPPPLSVTDDIMSRMHDDHPEVRIVAASFVRAHLEPGMAGAARALSKVLARDEPTLSLLALEALVRHNTVQAKAVLDAQSHGAGPTAARAAQLSAAFAPQQPEWSVAAPAPPAATLPRTDSQRTMRQQAAPTVDGTTTPPRHSSRMRPVTAGEPSAGETVEPKDAS